jgi:hypothetical protein
MEAGISGLGIRVLGPQGFLPSLKRLGDLGILKIREVNLAHPLEGLRALNQPPAQLLIGYLLTDGSELLQRQADRETVFAQIGAEGGTYQRCCPLKVLGLST